MPTRRASSRSWHWLWNALVWVVGIGLIGVLIAIFAGISVRAYRSFTHEAPATPAPQVTEAPKATCGPTSDTPCTEREARLQLQAAVDSGRLTAAPSVRERELNAEIAKARAEAEQAKAEWLQQQYQKLERNLQQQEVQRDSAPLSDISCNTSSATRERCKELQALQDEMLR